MVLDILIIGSGGAGLTTAIEAKRNGANVTVLAKTTITASQTCQAQGGINACMDEENDSIQNHINDTLKSAHEIGEEETISLMCKKAKETIQWLDNLAVPFSRDENGNIAQRKLGGTSNARACYSSDYTGLKILHTLYDSCLKEGINFLEEYMLLNIIVENSQAIGVSVLNIKTSKVEQILAKKIVVATGGYCGIYSNFNTNSTATTGDGIAASLRAAVTLSNMEYIQFHPTALRDNCILISESARGEGGYLVTLDGTRFVDELSPRDVVARAIYEKIQDGEDIYLDLRHLGKEKIMETMPQEYSLALQYTQLKMDEDLIPIKPVAHYSMGGIKTNKDGETNIKNLYAVGECANNSVHGANRLGGNSLLEIILFGRIVGQKVTQNLLDINIIDKEYDTFKDDEKYINEIFDYPKQMSFYDIKDSLGDELYSHVGLFRNESDLKVALEKIENWKSKVKIMGIGDKSKVYNTNLKEYLEFCNILDISLLTTTCAIQRRESRGAHFRVDFKEESKEFAKQSNITKDENKLDVEFL